MIIKAMGNDTAVVASQEIGQVPGYSVLQIGARPRDRWRELFYYFQCHGFRRFDIMEIFEENVVALQKQHSGLVYRGDGADINAVIPIVLKYDWIAWHHGPEHVSKERFIAAVPQLMAHTNIGLWVGCPNGVWEQDEIFNNPYEKHVAHWTAKELEDLGFKVYEFGEQDKHGTLIGIKRK